jgi:hypothetical protein
MNKKYLFVKTGKPYKCKHKKLKCNPGIMVSSSGKGEGSHECCECGKIFVYSFRFCVPPDDISYKELRKWLKRNKEMYDIEEICRECGELKKGFKTCRKCGFVICSDCYDVNTKCTDCCTIDDEWIAIGYPGEPENKD